MSSAPEFPALFTLRASRFVLRDSVLSGGSMVVRDGRIVAIGPADRIEAEGEVFHFPGEVWPGLVDLHVHGAGGCDFMDARRESFDTILSIHAAGGTTSLLPTTVTAALPDIQNCLKALAGYKAERNGGVRLLGAHIEGPWLAPTRPGVHQVSLLHPPTIDELDAMESAGFPLRIVTLAPELAGACAFVRELRGRGILASAGHSDAWLSDAEAAFAAGVSRTTHTFNCMSSARKRGPLREPGLVEWALTEPGVVCEVIADGAHVAPALLKMLVRCKGAAGISIISDATAACGYPEGQVFLLGGQECVVENGLCLTADRQTLAGSPVTMFESVHNMEQLADVPRVEAVRMASYNAAEALDLTAEVGSLTAGTNADFLLLDEQDQLLATYVSGTRIHPKFAI